MVRDLWDQFDLCLYQMNGFPRSPGWRRCWKFGGSIRPLPDEQGGTASSSIVTPYSSSRGGICGSGLADTTSRSPTILMFSMESQLELLNKLSREKVNLKQVNLNSSGGPSKGSPWNTVHTLNEQTGGRLCEVVRLGIVISGQL